MLRAISIRFYPELYIIALCLIGFASTHLQFFLLLAMLIGIGSAMVLSFKRALLVGIFIIPLLEAFTRSTYIPMSLATFIYLALFGRYIATQVANTNYYWPGIVITLVFIAYELSHVFYNPVMISTQTVRWLILFVFVSLLLFDRHKYVDFTDIRYALLVGLLVSTAFGLINKAVFPEVVYNDKIITRFSGATGDPNNFGQLCLLIIFYYLPNEPKQGIPLSTFAIVATIIACGSLTVSRSFFIVTFMSLLLYFVLYFRASMGEILYRIFFVIALSIVGVTFLLLSGEQIALELDIFKRFQADNLSQLTGARSDIVNEYVKLFISLPFVFLLFGAGINGYFGYYNYHFLQQGLFPEAVGPHNTPLEILVSFGVFGFAIVVTYIYMAFRAERTRGVREPVFKMAYLPLLVFMLYALSLQNLGQYSSYLILLTIILCIYRKSA